MEFPKLVTIDLADVDSYIFSKNKTGKHLYKFPSESARRMRLTYLGRYDKEM